MAWRVTGTYYVPCSCDVGCPCTFGELVGDRGWCSAGIVFNFRSGEVDGTDVGGTTVAMAVDWPSGYLAGNGTGKLYFDPDTSQEQRSILEPVMRGEQGGLFEALGALIPEFLPSTEARITFQPGEEATRVKVGEFGALVIAPLRDPEGNIATLRHGPAAIVEDTVMAKGTGSNWRDPEMREWTSGGHAEQGDFDWSA